MKPFEVFVDPKQVPIREAFIKAILARGNIVRFTNPDRFTKDVKEWNPDKDGDLTAFRKSPELITFFVCWATELYTISEITE